MQSLFLPLLSVDFPSWLKPEIIPGLPIRWYGLMYIFAFGTAFIVYRKQVKERNFPMTDDGLSSLFFWGILGLLLGARLFSTLIYETSDIYRKQPWLIFWPFRNGNFTGLQGMSYHGGAFAGLLAVVIFAKVKKFNFREIGDMFAAAIPIGFTFGRLGNFINAELYGRATASPFGMVFPHAKLLPANETWVMEIAEKTGTAVTGAFVNLPRHPSQLYEAFFEGIVLWALIWLFRNRKPFKGFLIGLYFLGYGFFRFIIEYFREPDAELGYRIEFVKTTLPTAYAHPLFSFSTGQVLCFWMIVFGIVWLIIASRLPDREPIRIYSDVKEIPEPNKEEAAKERNKRRKLRKKLK
ncbi:MAG: prolipoprotein diacylglyceryl transferase [Treponema sp.]|nr:prolipoprotein diacylglyceryl transferase [Treponema sp.]MCL2252507.1 prolipoprotein diacylglyceryl transferase [Treponema sp.]